MEYNKFFRYGWVCMMALCIAPTIISFQPYFYRWDDAGYLEQSINFSRHFWAGDIHAISNDFHDIRPPIMQFMGVPWGPATTSWNAAGHAFVTLAVFNAGLAATCLFLLLRLGVSRILLLTAGFCLFAALGPYPHPDANAHVRATGFMVDTLLAWTILATTLLIPYEEMNLRPSTAADILRGLLWGVIFSVGALTKTSFLYFVALVIPYLLAARWRRGGPRAAVIASISFVVCLLPAIGYWIRYGWSTLHNGWAASFGHDAPFYHVPLLQFVLRWLGDSPGMLLSVAFFAGCQLFLWKRGAIPPMARVAPFLIVLGYSAVSLSSQNRQVRYLFPGIVALPFLLALLASEKTHVVPGRVAAWQAALAFGCLAVAGIPTAARPNRQAIRRSEVVLAEAAQLKAQRIVLASDSPTLNNSLMRLAIAVNRSAVKSDTLAANDSNGIVLGADFREIRESDLVVIQDRSSLNSAFDDNIFMAPTNGRYQEYANYLSRSESGARGLLQTGDVTIYCMQCAPASRTISLPGENFPVTGVGGLAVRQFSGDKP